MDRFPTSVFGVSNTQDLSPKQRILITLAIVLVVIAAIMWWVSRRPKDVLALGPFNVGMGSATEGRGQRWLSVFTPEQAARVRGNNCTFSFFVYAKDGSQSIGLPRTDGSQYLVTVGNVVGVSFDTMHQNVVVDVLQAPPHSYRTMNMPVSMEGLVRSMTVKNVMIAKWNQVTVSIEGRSVDTYVNGHLVASSHLDNIPNAQLGGMLLNRSPDFTGQVCLFQMWPERRTARQVLENYQRNTDLRGKPIVPDPALSWGNVWERAKKALCDGTGLCSIQVKAGPLEYVEYEFA